MRADLVTDNTEKFIARFERTDDFVKEEMESCIEDAAHHAPRKTGALSRSGKVAREKQSEYVGGFTREYAPYRELGTEKAAAHPFLIPAFERMRQALPASLRAFLTPPNIR